MPYAIPIKPIVNALRNRQGETEWVVERRGEEGRRREKDCSNNACLRPRWKIHPVCDVLRIQQRANTAQAACSSRLVSSHFSTATLLNCSSPGPTRPGSLLNPSPRVTLSYSPALTWARRSLILYPALWFCSQRVESGTLPSALRCQKSNRQSCQNSVIPHHLDWGWHSEVWWRKADGSTELEVFLSIFFLYFLLGFWFQTPFSLAAWWWLAWPWTGSDMTIDLSLNWVWPVLALIGLWYGSDLALKHSCQHSRSFGISPGFQTHLLPVL